MDLKKLTVYNNLINTWFGDSRAQNAPFGDPRPDSESSRRDLQSGIAKTRCKAIFENILLVLAWYEF